MSDIRIDVVAHDELTPNLLGDLRRLFDDEYFDQFGVWSPEQPYGYAPHDHHVIASSDAGVVGHVGWGRRTVGVGGDDLVIAGVGGVLVSHQGRGRQLGAKLMARAAQSMREDGGIEFGYLGCREEVVPFYVSCGWHRISAGERSIGRDGRLTVAPPGQPILVFPVGRPLDSWPSGVIDLRGRAW